MCSAPNLLQKLIARCSSCAARSLLVAVLFCATSVFADLGVSVYTGTTAQSPVKNGAVYVSFTLSGFSGTIGNASFSNLTLSLPISSGFQGGVGQRLGAIPYTVTSGTLIITEAR